MYEYRLLYQNESKKNKSGMSHNIKIGHPRNAKRAPSAK